MNENQKSNEQSDSVVLREPGLSGVLNTSPLLQIACEAGRFGKHYSYPGGSVDQALFVFLSGEADRAFFDAHPALFTGSYLVCRSESWQTFLWSLPNKALHLTRWLMKPSAHFTYPVEKTLPSGYRVMPFDEEAFAQHPFDHGCNYPDAAAFADQGVGSVVRLGREIVCSASSFLSLEKDVELDISTLPEHRRKGLAECCIRGMLRQCEKQGLTVHWDAQNLPSKALAEKFGFVVDQDYAVTVLLPDNT